jgi:hypothetical protein
VIQVDDRSELPIEVGEARGSEPFDFSERGSGIVEEPLDVDTLTARRERRQIARTARQHVDRSVVIQPSQVVERHAYLKDALVQIPNIA